MDTNINKEWQLKAIESSKLMDNLVNSINNNQVYYQKNAFEEFLSWGNFISLLDYQYNKSKISEGNNPDHRVINKNGNVTNISKYTDFHYHLLEIVSSDHINPSIYNEFIYIKNMMNYFKLIFPSRFTLKALINLVGGDFVGEIHDDPYHVFSMQHLGTIEYMIKDIDGNSNTYILEPGDLLFIPSGMKHSVLPSEPRGTLIFDIERF